MNKAIITGRLGADIETFETGKGVAARFSVATSEGWKDGEDWKERTDWHTVKTFIPGLAEMLKRNGKKGRRIEIMGKLRTDKYTDKEGVDRWSTEIIIDREGTVDFPEPKRESPAAA
jgi:single-strand DNA-binding protein